MKRITYFFIAMLLMCSTGQTKAQLSLTAASTTYTIDFQTTIPGVNVDAFSSTITTAFIATPPASGQLDANGWAFVKDGAVDSVAVTFPGSGVADFTALTVPGGASTLVGWGSWNIASQSSFAMLPSGSNGTPGTLTLKITNNTGTTLTQMDISYYIAAYNDQPRGNKVDFLYSTDNVTYVKNPDLNFTSTAVATSAWESSTKSKQISGLTIPDGGTFYIRWAFADATGSGSRDEFMLDNITVMGTGGNPTIPTKLVFTSINGGVSPSANTPFSVTVQAQNSLGQAASVLTDKIVTVSVGNGSGTLGGILTGTMLAGSNSVTISNLTYSIAESNVTLAGAAQLLSSAGSDPFNVLTAADHLTFTTTPATGTTGLVIGAISIEAMRLDNTVDLNFHSSVSLLVSSGTGTMTGTTTKIATAGTANFSDIVLSAPGNYVLLATADNVSIGLSGTIVIGQGMQMTELVVPKYIGSKSAASANNCRTTYAVCLGFTYLQPSTSYDLRTSVALTSEAVTSFGAGNVWTGTAFGSNSVTGYFTTDANGNSGPVWVYCQTTGNASRFDAGQVHNLRIGITPTGTIMPSVPSFVGTKTITALDIPLTPRTVATTDDGAFVHGHADASWSGKMLMIYNNVDGTGDPLFSYQVRQTTPTPAANTELPGVIDSIWRQISGVAGDWAAVVPVGEINANGIRRIEARNADNTVFAYLTDADGIWPGANTTTPVRRDILYIDQTALASTTLTGQVTYANTISTPLDSVHVYVKDAIGTVVMDGLANNDGYFSFTGLANGTYTLSVTCTKPRGGANSVDALGVLKHFVGMTVLTGLNKTAADVSGGLPMVVNSLDALMIQQNFVGLISAFPAGSWCFETPSVVINGGGTYTQNIKGLCIGDLNGSFIPAK